MADQKQTAEEIQKGSEQFAERQGYIEGMKLIPKDKSKKPFVYHTEPGWEEAEKLRMMKEDQNRTAPEE